MMIIKRKYFDNYTLSKLFFDNVYFCRTIERPWLDNRPFISCIPEGIYDLVPFDSPKHGETVAFLNHELGIGIYKGEAKRWSCLIHPANWAHELNGCVAPGFGIMYDPESKDIAGVTHSRETFHRLIDEIMLFNINRCQIVKGDD